MWNKNNIFNTEKHFSLFNIVRHKNLIIKRTAADLSNKNLNFILKAKFY